MNLLSDSDKQVNQGWGDNAKEGVAEAQGEADAQAEATAPAAPEADWGSGAPAADWGAAGEVGETAPPKEDESKPARPVEEEDKTMTLDEYRKSKENTLADLIQSSGPRQANEGEKELFKNAEKLSKDGDDYFSGLQKVG